MTQDLDSAPITAFERALQLAAPGVRPGQLVALFEGKADRTAIAHWRSGRHSVPRWAIERIRQIHAERTAALESSLAESLQKETGPGRRAGKINLARWLAANPRQPLASK